MTKKELIEKLQEKGDETTPVTVAKTIYAQGGSRTGMYECGDEPVKIIEIIFKSGDELGGVNELDEVDHFEIIIEDY